ncbi:hypothetical protein HAX54_028068 [Datura stramonium]|uniref:Pentatricopeptide repeat-containing protein n=1 Tax=Datura stramonium TaxID=4076 RepID=A0ABS8S9D8_DATST|nr:hypothetical protein [Datura stramonium]
MSLSYNSFSPVLTPVPPSHRFLFPAKIPNYDKLSGVHHRLLLTVAVRAKPKDLILGNPTVTVEKGKYSYDVETLINKLSNFPPRGSIARCLDTFKNKLSLSDFSLVFKEFAARGDWQRSLRLFKYMQRQIWCKPNEHIYTLMIGILGREGLLDKAFEIFDEMPTHNVARTLFGGDFWETGEVGKGLRIAHGNGGLQKSSPEITSYNVLLEAYAHLGSMKEAMDVFRQMQAAGCVANAETYSILLNLYGKNGRYDQVRDLFLEMAGNTERMGYIQYSHPGLWVDMPAGKGGLHEDAKRILLHMNGQGLVPSSKVYTGVIEAYGQAALYEEAVVAFNEDFTKNLKQYGLEWMGEVEFPNRDSFNGVIEGYRQGGQFEEAIKAYVEMEKARCDPDERTLEAVLSVYCFAGLVDESEEQFQEIKSLGIQPSIICCCMMLAIYAKEWNMARELLNDVMTNKTSDMHQIIGQMIHGDFNDENNGRWLSMSLTNSSQDSLSMRMWPGGACTAISVWLNDMEEWFHKGEDLPQLASVVVVRGQAEKSLVTRRICRLLRLHIPF